MHTARRIAAATLMAAAAHLAHAAAAYPPSCFAAGLPLGQSASDTHAQSLPLTLHGDFNACFVNPAASDYAQAQAECAYSETVAITTWRVACSGGKSATLLEIDRPANMQGNTDLYPTFPEVFVQQGANIAFIRLAQDANTLTTNTWVNSPVYQNSIYALENFSAANYVPVDYNQAFTLIVNSNLGHAVEFDLGVYQPADYPAASQPLPITGYLTAAWYDPAHGGEGILTEVVDAADGTRTLFVTWYTFNAMGLPFWLVAQGTLAIGATHIDNVPVQYLGGGGFAGNFSSVMRSSWGTMSFAFPDCNTLNFSYSGATDAQTNGPAGTGNRTWKRLGDIANLGCQ